jgi:hypothetical protein
MNIGYLNIFVSGMLALVAIMEIRASNWKFIGAPSALILLGWNLVTAAAMLS